MSELICANCGHAKESHWNRYGCEVEGPDAWVEGVNCGGLVASGPCGCMDFQAELDEFLKADDLPDTTRHPLEPTIAEGYARITRALDRLTAAALRQCTDEPDEEAERFAKMEENFHDSRAGTR